MIFATTLENKGLFKGHFVHLASLLLFYNNTRIYIVPFPWAQWHLRRLLKHSLGKNM